MKLDTRMFSLLLLASAVTACTGGQQDAAAPTAEAPAAAPTPTEVVPAVAPPVFQGAIASLEVAGQCSLDVLNGVVLEPTLTAKPGDALTFSGWVVDAQVKVPAQAQFVLNSPSATYAFPMALGGVRQDVADALKNPDARQSGYDVGVDIRGAIPGDYDLGIVLGDAPGVLCPLNRKFTIAG